MFKSKKAAFTDLSQKIACKLLATQK